MKIVLASKNSGKVEEIKRIFGVNYEILTLSECAEYNETNENGSTYEENALKKALDARKFITDLPILSDDSGIEIDYLGGKPGINTARFAKENATENENIDKILKELAGVPSEKRKAKFVCIAVLIVPKRDIRIFRGECEGEILAKRTGESGFGLDPIFRAKNFEKSMAEIPENTKNQISHRAIAFLKAKQSLEN